MTNNSNNHPEEISNLKGYLFFFSGQLVSLFGSSIIQFVIAWWITVETESPMLLSLSLFIGFIPTVLLTPIAGVLIDRLNLKFLIGFVDFMQAAVTVVLLFLFKFNKVGVGLLLFFIAIRGAFQAFQQPALQTIIPIMVPKKHLNRMNSFQFLFTSAVFVVGPVTAAFLYATIPIHLIMLIEPITFGAAIIPLVFITIPKVVKQIKEKAEKTSFISEMKEGVQFIRKKKGLLPLLGSFTAANFFIMPMFTLINLFVYSTHGGDETNLAFVFIFLNVGTIAGSLLLTLWKGFKKKVNGVVIGILFMFIGSLIASLTPNGLFWFMGLGMLVVGISNPVANISSQTIWQTIVPKDKLGRVMSVRLTIAQFTAPLGMLLSGFIAKYVKMEYLFAFSALLGLLFLGLFWINTSMRNVEDDIDYTTDERGSEPILSSKKDFIQEEVDDIPTSE